jgi:hypothetical protein
MDDASPRLAAVHGAPEMIPAAAMKPRASGSITIVPFKKFKSSILERKIMSTNLMSSTTTENTQQAGMADPSQAEPLLQALTLQAASLLGVENVQLVPFAQGAQGGFPYYWLNPSNIKEFNDATYTWISSNLKANSNPVQLDDASFPTLYSQVLSKISYQLSSADLDQINQANQNNQSQQAALLQAWQAAFGSVPTPQSDSSTNGTSIDQIMNTIETQWASPATTLLGLRNAPNLYNLLGNAPAAGMAVIPALSEYLATLDNVISLENQATMNNGYLRQALQALQEPAANGGMVTDGNRTVPVYQVNSSLSQIQDGLKGSSSVKISMEVSRTSFNQVTISLSGGGSFTMDVDDFLAISTEMYSDYFNSQIASSANQIQIDMEFPGVTLVSFGPMVFDSTSGTGWFWEQPVTEAIQNGSADVSGFKFTVNPETDFSSSGPFGFLNSVVISNFPTITITVTGSDYNNIESAISEASSLGISFLGIPLDSASQSAYSHNVNTNSAASSVTIQLVPPPNAVSDTIENLRGWVLGVQTDYPAA